MDIAFAIGMYDHSRIEVHPPGRNGHLNSQAEAVPMSGPAKSATHEKLHMKLCNELCNESRCDGNYRMRVRSDGGGEIRRPQQGVIEV